MFNAKRFISVALAIAACLNLGATALASTPSNVASNPKVTVINHSKYISRQAIQEVMNDVSASIIHDDGTVDPLDAVVTIPMSMQQTRDVAPTAKIHTRLHLIKCTLKMQNGNST